MNDLEDLKMILSGCDITEIRQMNFRFNNNTYEIFYNGKFYQLCFRNFKCVDVYCLSQ